jgi:hypothetical protein
MKKIIVKFKLQPKLSYVVTDDASNMKKPFRCLWESQAYMDYDSLWEDLKHDQAEVSDVIESNRIKRLPCHVHILQLAIKDYLSTIATSPVLSKTTALTNLTHHSSLIKDAFEAHFGNNSSEQN